MRLQAFSAAMVAAVGWFALAGCMLAPVEAGYSLDGKGNTGVVFLSLTRSGSLESNMVIKLRGLTGGPSKEVWVDDSTVKRDWGKIEFNVPAQVNDLGHASREEPVGYVAAFALPPGEYEIYEWTGNSPMWNLPGDDYQVHSQRFSVKFSVQPGAATYVGSLQIIVPDRIIADHRTGVFEVAVADRRERDAAVLRQKYPSLAEKLTPGPLMVAANAGQPLTFYVVPVSGKTRNGDGSFL